MVRLNGKLLCAKVIYSTRMTRILKHGFIGFFVNNKFGKAFSAAFK